MTYIYSDNDRHPVSKTFTTLHYTCRHFTSSHLNFTQLHFTTLSFGLTPFKFSTAPFTALLDDFRQTSIPFIKVQEVSQNTTSCCVLTYLPVHLCYKHDDFGGLVVSMLASGNQVCGFKPGRSRWIFRK